MRVAGPSGPISNEGLGLVALTIEDRRPLAIEAHAENASAQPVVVEGTLFVAPGMNLDDVLAAANAAVDAYAQESDIGATIYRARLIARLVDTFGARNVILTQPTDDVRVPTDRVFVPTYSLTAAVLT